MANLKGYNLKNENKYRVAAEGDGHNFEGVGYDNEDALLAEYDRRGGAIFKGGRKIATGSFYDFKAKKPRAKPVVTFEDGKPAQKGGTSVEVVSGPKETTKVTKAKNAKPKDEDDEETGDEDE